MRESAVLGARARRSAAAMGTLASFALGKQPCQPTRHSLSRRFASVQPAFDRSRTWPPDALSRDFSPAHHADFKLSLSSSRSLAPRCLARSTFGHKTFAGHLDLILLTLVSSILPPSSRKRSLSHPFGPCPHRRVTFAGFTIEYMAGLRALPTPAATPTSFFGFVDLLAVAPVSFSVRHRPLYRRFVQSLRLLRVFRILKLTEYRRSSGSPHCHEGKHPQDHHFSFPLYNHCDYCRRDDVQIEEKPTATGACPPPCIGR